jgi:rhodanese-related sulfurtransferase
VPGVGEAIQAKGLGAKEAREAIASQDGGAVRVIDIRSTDEFGKGHIAGAINVEDGDPESVRRAIEEEEDRAERWLVVCAEGKRSREVASNLAERDIEVAYLEGGMEAWAGDKLPVQPPPAESEFEGPKKTTIY